ncbi:ParA family partition ATPase [Anabaena azotica]|uniref:ParA family partition ATPase n=1 Tax=Anabaena azotica TaxID=197653 RepID=UPI0039A5ED88
MKVISIVSQKGGVGKSTISIHLATAAVIKKKEAALIDLDPQASASKWSDSREAEYPVVISCQASRLEKVLAAAQEEKADFVVIDSAPHSESAALAAIRAADLILIPCQPSILDLRAISDTIDLVRLAQKDAIAIALLNCVPTRGTLGDEAAEAIKQYSIPIAPVKISERTAFVRCLSAGLTVMEYEPKGKASEEIWQLYKWICQQVKL